MAGKFPRTGSWLSSLAVSHRRRSVRRALRSAVYAAEPLELRRMLDSCPTPASNLQVVHGTAGNDFIAVAGSGPYAVVVNGNVTATVDLTKTLVLCGDAGDDFIQIQQGFAPYAYIHGGPGDDRLEGGLDEIGVYISGEDGNDRIFGSSGSDFLLGGDDNDTISGQLGNDYIDGGYGDDDMHGGGGTDTASYAFRDSSSFLRITLDNLPNDGQRGTMTIAFEFDNVADDIEVVFGGQGKDTLIGNGGPNIFYGNGGNDVIQGAGGADQLYGGIGNDTLSGDDGSDTVSGEGGNDVIQGGPDADLLVGGDGNDLIQGGDGNDTIWGGQVFNPKGPFPVIDNDGDDTLFGDGGDDFISGGAGGDEMHGGTGTDTVSYLDGYNSAFGPGVSITLDNVANDGELLLNNVPEHGNVFDDFEVIIGSAGYDTITGTDRGEVIDGSFGDDVIDGRGGDDTLIGGSGIDQILGGDGNDFIYGCYVDPTRGCRTGGETMIGGAGDDHFGVYGNYIFDDQVDGGTGLDFLDFEQLEVGINGPTSYEIDGSTIQFKFITGSGTQLHFTLHYSNIETAAIGGTDVIDQFSITTPLAIDLSLAGRDPTTLPGDQLSIMGPGIGNGMYAPGVLTGTGVITLNSHTINFTGLEPVVIDGFGSFTLLTPQSQDLLNIDSPSPGQGRISGTSGGVAFESLLYSNTPSIVLDLATNDAPGSANDVIRIAPGGLPPAILAPLDLGSSAFSKVSIIQAIPASGPAFRVNSYTFNDQRLPVTAMDADGDFVVAWQSYVQDLSVYGIYAQRYNAAGVRQGGEFRVNTFTAGNQEFPAIAMDPDGDFVVTWASFNQDGSGFGIYAQRYNAVGVPQGIEFQVNTYATGDQLFPAVAMDVAGDFVVSWGSNGQDGTGGGIGVYAQRYNYAGVPMGSEFRVNTTLLNDQMLPAVAMNAAGDFAVTWQSDLQDGSGFGIYGRRFNAAGVAQGGEFRVNTTKADQQTLPAIAMDMAGDFVVTWQSYGQDGSIFGIYAQRYNAAGVAQGSEFRANTYIQSSQSSAAIAMDTAGDFVISWRSYGQDGSTSGVYAQRYNAAGVVQDTEFRVNTTTLFYQEAPAVAMDADGDFVIAWEGSESYYYSNIHDIVAQRYTGASNLSGPIVTEVSAGGERIVPGGKQVQAISLMVVTFSENLSPNLLFFKLQRNGVDIPVINAINFNFDVPTGKYEALVYLTSTLGNGPAGDGQYTLIVKQAITDSAGNALDGNLDGKTGGDFSLSFTIANPVNISPEFLVNSTTPANQINPAVATDAAGDFVVAWQSLGQDGSGYGIYAQRYNAAGVKQGNESQVNATTSNDQQRPAVAMDAVGNFVIAWQSSGQDGSGTGIYARRYNAAGIAQGSEFKVNATTLNDQEVPAVAMDAGGEFVVTWESYNQDGGGFGIYAQRYNAAGVAQGGEFLVNFTTANHQSYPAVAMDVGGDFVMAWQSTGQDGSGDGIYAQRYDRAGTARGGEFRVNTTTAGAQDEPAVAMDSAGNVVVSWRSFDQNGSRFNIYAQRFDAAGVAQGSEFRVNTFTKDDHFNHAVGMDADGDFVIVWDSSDHDGSGRGIYTQRYNALGEAQGVEFRVNSTTLNDQELPAVAMDTDGDFVVAWESYSGTDTSGAGIYAQRYNANQAPTALGFNDIVLPLNPPDYTVALSSGFADSTEAARGLTYYVTSISDPTFFATTPTVNGDTLLLHFPPGRYGTVQLTLRATDSGGLFVQTSLKVSISVPVLDGSIGDDMYDIHRVGNNIQISMSSNSTLIFKDVIPLANLPYFVINPSAGNDSLTVDFAFGNPLPPGGIIFSGGAPTTAPGDSVTILGTTAFSAAYTPSATDPASGYIGVGGAAISFTGVESVSTTGFASLTVLTPGRTNSLSVAGSGSSDNFITGVSGGMPIESLRFSNIPTLALDTATNDPTGTGNDDMTVANSNGLNLLKVKLGGGTNTLNIIGVAMALDASAGGANLAVNVSNNATLSLTASQTLASLNIATGSRVNVTPGGSKVMRTSGLSIAGTLDLADNDLILQSTASNRAANLVSLSGLVKTGRNGGDWAGTGITSSAAAAEPNKLTGVAIVLNENSGGTTLYNIFDGEPVDVNSMLVKYTYNGDADLSGKIDADDYFQIDNGFAQKLAGYRNGDFDFNGTVDADDYFLIDRAFVGQTGMLAASQPAASAITGLAHTGRHRRAMHHRARR